MLKIKDNKDKGFYLFLWVAIIYALLVISCFVIKTIIIEDEKNRDSVFGYCANYVREEFTEEYGKFDLTLCIGKISYIKELNKDNIKSAGYKIELRYQVDNVWHTLNYGKKEISWIEELIL